MAGTMGSGSQNAQKQELAHLQSDKIRTMRTLSDRYWTAGFFVMALAAATCLLYGFVTEHTLEQPIWNPLGLRRLMQLAGVCVISALACYRINRQLLIPLGAGMGAFLAVTSFGFGPVAAAAFYACSAVALGDALLHQLGVRREATPAAAFAPLAFLLGISLIVFAVGISAHFPVNYTSVYVAALCVPLVLNRKAWRHYAAELAGLIRPRATKSASGFAAFVLLGFVVLCHFLVVLKPEVGFDALVMHLMVPAYVASHGLWSFDVSNVVWAVAPMAGDWAYTGAYLLGGEYAARLTNFVFLVVILAVLYWFARRWLRRPLALLTVSLFASTPLVQLMTGSLLIENMQAAMILAAALSLERLQATREKGYLVAASLLLGTAVATKFGSVAFVLPIALIGAIRLRHPARGWTLPFWSKLIAACAFVLAAAPPYAYAWWLTGNPVFPFMNDIFRSPMYPQIPFPNPFAPKFSLVNVLYRLTFHSHEFMESQNGCLGFHYLFFIPLSVLLLGRRCFSRIGAVVATAVVASALILYSQPNLRYLYAALPFWSILIFYTVSAATRRGRSLSLILIVGCVGLVFLNVYFLPASGWYQKDFWSWNPLGRRDYDQYETASAPVRKLVTFLNLKYPGQPVWFIGTSQIAELQGKAYLTSWYQHSFLNEIFRCSRSADVLDLVTRHNIRHFVVPADLRNVKNVPESVKTFLQESTEKDWAHGSFILLRLKREAEFSRELLDTREFGAGWPGWQRNGKVVIEPHSGTARVTLSDTLVRGVPVDDSRAYRYSMEAYCEDPATVLRLQINWHDSSGKFIGTTIDPRPCGPAWNNYTRDMTPPAGARSGVVIVGGHGPQPVLVRSVSLKY